MIMVLAAPVRADEPKPVIAKAVEQILGFLRDPALQSARDAQAVKIKSVARTIFDYRVISMRTLGRHWKSFSPAQQEEFVTLYSDLLENTYVKRLQAYQNEQVVVGEEVKLEEGKTEVRTSVLAAAGPVLPAEMTPSQTPSFTSRVATTTEESFFLRTACTGCSSIAMTSLA